MKIFGQPRIGDTIFEIPADYKRVARFRSPAVASRVPKMTIYCDGLGAGVGDQHMRGVIYDFFGNLVAKSDEVVVRDGQPPGWVDLSFLREWPTGVPLAVATLYDLGIHAGPIANTIRVYGRRSVGL